jgi:hypothetical protein
MGFMLIGRQFRLGRDTLAFDLVDGKPRAIIIPVGEIIKALSWLTNGDAMVDVRWGGRTVATFAVDVNVRGTEIADRTAEA